MFSIPNPHQKKSTPPTKLFDSQSQYHLSYEKRQQDGVNWGHLLLARVSVCFGHTCYKKTCYRGGCDNGSFNIASSCASCSFDICYKRCGNVSSNFYLYFPSSFFSFIFIVPLMIIMILWQIHPQFLGKGNFKLNLLRITLVPLATFPLGNDRVPFKRFWILTRTETKI